MKFSINRDCDGCGVCTEIRSDLFAVVPEGQWQTAWEYDEDDIIDCALACPKCAIRIEDY